MAGKLSYEELEQKVEELGKNTFEHKQTVEALRESEEKYRTLFENSKDAISITTRNGEYIAFNQSFLDLFGYTKEDMINMRAQEKYLDPNGRNTFKKEVEEKPEDVEEKE